ncbi:hypothetical protein L798_13521 [Zootermopsis nevadensis]|uniref:Uncharacterized protein n=1 Tax=Zootermopsis nevadensis TaxID=136037 RepID=A0A067QU23_ZOONE|nr:hypothetical protein L798_13521 [Zootermopsis nevadensis]
MGPRKGLDAVTKTISFLLPGSNLRSSKSQPLTQLTLGNSPSRSDSLLEIVMMIKATTSETSMNFYLTKRRKDPEDEHIVVEVISDRSDTVKKKKFIPKKK